MKQIKLNIIKSGTKWALAFLLAMSLQPVMSADAGKSQAGGRSPQYTQQDTKACTRCHSGEVIQVITKGAHGNKDNSDAPFAKRGCESCHGPGSFHVSRAHGGQGLPSVITFGAGKRTPRGKQLNACLHCHAKATGKIEGMEWQGSIHDGAQMTCSGCHKVHSTENKMANRQEQAEACFMCHPQQKTEHRRFENMGIVFDELSCWNCHDVHQLQRAEKAAGE